MRLFFILMVAIAGSTASASVVIHAGDEVVGGTASAGAKLAICKGFIASNYNNLTHAEAGIQFVSTCEALSSGDVIAKTDILMEEAVIGGEYATSPIQINGPCSFTESMIDALTNENVRFSANCDPETGIARPIFTVLKLGD
jgi:hypothetical protein